MAEYASKGLAGTALGFGIGGAALGLLNNGGNILGVGNGGANSMRQHAALEEISSLQAEVAQLKSEKYADSVGKDVYAQSLRDNRYLDEKLSGTIVRLADEAASNRERVAVLEAQVKCNQEKADLREQIVLGKINEVALVTKGKFDALDNTITCIANTVNGITKTVVPNEAVCPGWGSVCVETVPCPKTATSR